MRDLVVADREEMKTRAGCIRTHCSSLTITTQQSLVLLRYNVSSHVLVL